MKWLSISHFSEEKRRKWLVTKNLCVRRRESVDGHRERARVGVGSRKKWACNKTNSDAASNETTDFPEILSCEHRVMCFPVQWKSINVSTVNVINKTSHMVNERSSNCTRMQQQHGWNFSPFLAASVRLLYLDSQLHRHELMILR